MDVRHNFKLGILGGTLAILMILNKIYEVPSSPVDVKSDSKK